MISPASASKTQIKIPTTMTQAMTVKVLLTVCLGVGQTTFLSSLFISRNQRPIRWKRPGLASYLAALGFFSALAGLEGA